MNILGALLWVVVFFNGNPVTLKPHVEGDFLVKQGWFNNQVLYYTPFAASDPKVAEQLNFWATKFDKEPGDMFLVDYAPALQCALNTGAVCDVYFIHCGQTVVFASQPGLPCYTPLWRVTYLEWAPGVTPTFPTSQPEVLDQIAAGNLIQTRPYSVLDATIVQNTAGKLLPQAGQFEVNETQKEIHLPVFEVFFTQKNQVPHRQLTKILLTDTSDPLIAARLGANYSPRLATLAAAGCCNNVFAFANPVPFGQDPIIDQIQRYAKFQPVNTNQDYNPIKCWTILSRGTLPTSSIISSADTVNVLLNNGVISVIPGAPIVTNSPVPQLCD